MANHGKGAELGKLRRKRKRTIMNIAKSMWKVFTPNSGQPLSDYTEKNVVCETCLPSLPSRSMLLQCSSKARGITQHYTLPASLLPTQCSRRAVPSPAVGRVDHELFPSGAEGRSRVRNAVGSLAMSRKSSRRPRRGRVCVWF